MLAGWNGKCAVTVAYKKPNYANHDGIFVLAVF